MKRKLEIEDEMGYWYLVVPNEIGTYGQILFVVKKLEGDKKHISDITDSELLQNNERLKSILKGLSTVSSKLKTSLIDDKGRKVKKVYVLTQCEGKNTHLHFHLYPRFEHDFKGNEFLYTCELKEARWQDPPMIKPKKRIGKGKKIIEKFEALLDKNQFLLAEEYKQKTSKKMVNELNQILK